MIKKINVPYYSQYTNIKDEYWKPRACGALCLKMVLDFLVSVNFGQPSEISKLSADDFVLFANESGAYGTSGWIHQGLINIAEKFGIKMERKEFKDKLLLNGIKEIKKSLKTGKPVLVSVVKRFSEKDKFHMVVLTGYKSRFGFIKGFYYNDTDYQNAEDGKDLFVDTGTFRKYWRRLAIFVE